MQRTWAERIAELAFASEGRAGSGRARGTKRVLVLGTGTEIGKTHVSVRVLDALAARGTRAIGVIRSARRVAVVRAQRDRVRIND